MLTLFLVFIITKGALTLYEGNTIGGRAIRVGDTAQVHSTAAFWSGWHNGRLFLTVTYSVMHKYRGTVVE